MFSIIVRYENQLKRENLFRPSLVRLRHFLFPLYQYSFFFFLPEKVFFFILNLIILVIMVPW